MSNYEFNKDYPAKRKPGRPKRVLTSEEGAAQIMAVINGDTPPPKRQNVRRRSARRLKRQKRSCAAI